MPEIRKLFKVEDPSKIPKGAVILSRDEVMQYNFDLTSKWEPKSEVWPFVYGSSLLSSCAGFGGFLCNNFYRRKLLLQSYFRISTYIPLVGLPVIIAPFFHTAFVKLDLFQGKQCAVCLGTKAALLQAFVGCVYPMILSPAVSFYLADRCYTYPVPSLMNAYKELFQLWCKFTLPHKSKFFALLGLQIVAAIFITYQEQLSLYKLHENISNRES